MEKLAVAVLSPPRLMKTQGLVVPEQSPLVHLVKILPAGAEAVRETSAPQVNDDV